MGLTKIAYDAGQTPLDEDERQGLRIPSVTTRRELDEVEQRNIEEAMRWIAGRRRRFTAKEVLTEAFICEMHRRMLGDVWTWAGSFRESNKNIGVDKYQIGTELRMLLEDCRYWIDHQTFGQDEMAVRFKHRIVSVHCFPNGNGRHSRLMGDVLVEKVFGKELFTWGGERAQYLEALREADVGRFERLIAFART